VWPVRWWPPTGPWQGEQVSETTAATPGEPAGWVDLPDVAERLDVPVSRVHQMVRDGTMLAVRRDGVLRVPQELLANRTVLKHLPGVLTVLHDAGYNDEESLRWLYERDDSLPGGAAVYALAGDGATEVKRRAQALGF
jgi:hypothetical protein